MELLFYGNGASNFGDDLNLIVWKRVLPSWVFEVDDVALLGIGTVFTDQWTDLPRVKGKRVFVLGSGAGYLPLPRDRASWTILAVRGPLTAALIDRPELAATDAAALLAAIPPLVAAPQKRDKVLLIPHHESISGSRWQEVAEQAGVTFVDPRWPPMVVLEHFAQAKLVLAEAMHGAIVADALRIPWIPWAASPYHLPFKWIDWTMSLGMKYEPVVFPPITRWDNWRHRIATIKASRQGVSSSVKTIALKDPADYVKDFRARYNGVMTSKRKPSRRLHRIARSTAVRAAGIFDRGRVGDGVDAVNKLLTRSPYLSADGVFNDRLNQLQEGTHTLVRLLQKES